MRSNAPQKHAAACSWRQLPPRGLSDGCELGPAQAEYGVCCHTFVNTGKVNKLMRESMGRPTSSLISRSETAENLWSILYA